MKQFTFTMLVLTFSLGVAGVSYADTLSGKVKDIDTTENSITLVSQPGETGSAEYKLVWENNRPEFAPLTTAHVGESLTVDAEQNPVTRNWKVTTVRGPLSTVENAISSDERLISGEIRNLDTHGNSAVLESTEADVSGKLIEYHVVWDSTNANVRNRFEKARLGDKITVKAEQNKITRNWKANAIVGSMTAIIKDDVKTITGEVRSVDPAKNYIILRTTDLSGKVVDRRIVWDKDFKEQTKLEKAQIGDHLSVRADQNMLTRSWKVKALGA